MRREPACGAVPEWLPAQIMRWLFQTVSQDVARAIRKSLKLRVYEIARVVLLPVHPHQAINVYTEKPAKAWHRHGSQDRTKTNNSYSQFKRSPGTTDRPSTGLHHNTNLLSMYSVNHACCSASQCMIMVRAHSP